jgi:hypothetical protein
MKSPLLPFRANLDSGGLLDRGGRPTLRELLGGLEFDAATGALRLGGERLTLQLAEADRILRRELIQLLGEDEARIFLLRRGFRMGLNDAAYVARAWPSLDRGDAFTAGTRLHQFSGIVRVETLHNDFDFARGRFSAEFLWHNSLEAEDGNGTPLRSDRPVCWQQLGYASGYATHFFGALVVYKETACAAQGHKCCRVAGRLATGWGEDDPDVVRFRNRVIPPAPAERRRSPSAGVSADAADAPLLVPVLRRLERAAQLPLPCLIAGAGSCGQEIAAQHLARLTGRAEGMARLHAASTGTEALRAALAQQRKPRRKDLPPVLLLEGIEALAPAVQAELARDLAEGEPNSRPHLVATARQPLAALAAGVLQPALWARLAPMAIELPPLSERAAGLPELAGLRLERLAAQLGIDPPEIDPGALEALALQPPEGGLDGLDALLTALLVEAAGGLPLSAAMIARERTRIAPPPRHRHDNSAGGIDDWIAGRMAEGRFSLEAHEARIRALALDRAGGNLAAAARMLGISRAQLAYRQKTAEK